MFEEEPVLGQNGKNLSSEMVVEVSSYLDDRSLLSLSATSHSALLFFKGNKGKRDEIRENRKMKWKKFEEDNQEHYDANLDGVNAVFPVIQDNNDIAQCLVPISSVFLMIGVVFTAVTSGLSWKDDPVTGFSLATASASMILLCCCINSGRNLSLCKDTLFAQRNVERARKAQEALESPAEVTVLIPEEEETGNDNDNNGPRNYGAIN